MMARYAEKTSVEASKSRAEIERILIRYGADQFMYGWDDNSESLKAIVAFRMNSRYIKFFLPMPSKSECSYTSNKKYKRDSEKTLKAWEQATRQRWRALALVIKAKLEAVESGITEFETEFMAHIVLPDGQTVGQFMLPQIASAYEKREMPGLLPDMRKSK
jgi:hypothetical protein